MYRTEEQFITIVQEVWKRLRVQVGYPVDEPMNIEKVFLDELNHFFDDQAEGTTV